MCSACSRASSRPWRKESYSARPATAAPRLRLPVDPELYSQYLLLYELSLPFGLDLNNQIDVAKSATRMTVVMRSLTSQA